ncbi:hypothetical protein ACTPEU_00445, partial [Clostridioides difficile]
NVYNDTYEEIIYIEDIIEEYRRKEYNLEDVDSIVYDNVNDMILPAVLNTNITTHASKTLITVS